MPDEPVHSQPLLSKPQCDYTAERVLSLRQHWRSRGNGTFFTLGASTYNDEVLAYPGIAWQDNAVLTRHFGALMQAIADFYENALGKPVVYLHTHGLPGFHIFDSRCRGMAGHVHIDEPYTKCFWPTPISGVFSFTMAIRLPGEGGLNFYPGLPVETIMARDRGEAVELPEPEYFPYEEGTLYWHSGHTPHQIANPCEIGEDQHRITLQGHGAELTTGQIVLYF